MKGKNIFFSIVAFCFLNSTISAQEIPPSVRVVNKDTLVDLKKESFFERMAERYTKDTILPNKKGIVGKPGSTIGVGYRIRTTRRNQVPFGSQHSLTINYGINRGAIFVEHKSIFHQVIGQWSMQLNTRADIINIINYYGTGNTSQRINDDEYYELKSREWMFSLGFGRLIRKYHELELQGFFQSIKLHAEEGTYVFDLNPDLKLNAERKNYAGLSAAYLFHKQNNLLAPTRGWEFGFAASHSFNLRSGPGDFSRFSSFISSFLPLSDQFTFASRVGGATILGDPDFYQLNVLGGRETLRGYTRQRFYGTTSLFTNQELRWLVPTSKKFFQRIGLLSFIDAGRVWQKNEQSDKIHVGYGGGLIIIPFNRIVLNGTIGYSEEGRRMHLRVGYLF